MSVFMQFSGTDSNALVVMLYCSNEGQTLSDNERQTFGRRFQITNGSLPLPLKMEVNSCTGTHLWGSNLEAD